MPKRSPPSEILRRNRLLFGILACIALAAAQPRLGSKQGPLRTEWSVRYGAVSLIFLLCGLSLRSDNISSTFRRCDLHGFVQLFTFVLVPVVVRAMVGWLGMLGVNSWILKGLLTVACMPPPVSSAVILTRAANGNETAAIINSILGSFLGVIVTPISLLCTLGSTTMVPLFGAFLQLTSTVLMPLAIGQLLRKFVRFQGRLPLDALGQVALLFVVYTTFCDTFSTPEAGLSAPDVLLTVLLVVLLQVTLLTVSYAAATRLRFSTADVVAVVFCSTHKSLTLGIPILHVMFHGLSHLSQISLPLLVYHPTQIILGGLLVTHLRDWAKKEKDERLPV